MAEKRRGPGRPSYDSKQKLVAAACGLLAERGFEATSPQMFQQRSGVGHGSMYHHFPGKGKEGLARVLTISSEPGDLVIDPFGGSGTTFAVAERMHRHWAGCELGDADPLVRRLTGLDPQYAPPGHGDAGKGSNA